MIDWKRIIISPNTTLLEALSVLEKAALRIVLVVGEDEKLLGTLTDGDARRAILNHGDLQVTADTVMNKNPTTVLNTLSVVEIDTILQSKNLTAIPVIDENNGIIGLHTLQNYFQNQVKDNPVFIMAGGFGTRLKPLTDSCPKPMLEVGGKPILETILDSFLAVGFRNFYFSTHYLPNVIRNYFGDGSKFGCSIKYVHEDTPLGTGGALGLLPDDLPNLPIIMINGDILTKVNFEHLLADHTNKGNIATMCVKQHQYKIPYGVIKEHMGNVIGVDEKPTQTYFINAGIYVINPKLISRIVKGIHLNMPPFLMQQVDEGEKVNLFPIHEYWLDIGQPHEFEKAQFDIRKLF